MYPQLFEIASVDAGVRDILGTDPVRLFLFGSAPDTVALPYAVWQVVGGSPESYITNTPDIDLFTVQIDVYGSTPNSARAAAEALRDVIELTAEISSWRGGHKDIESGAYRYSFDVNFLTAR